MDYIREELLRQNRILTRLMVGAEPQQEQDTAEKESWLFSVEKGTSARELWSRSAAEEVSVASLADAGTDGDRRLQQRRLAEPYSEEMGWNSFYVGSKLPKEARKATDIRAVSRCIQRDARRYDGGFSIY